VRSYSHFVGIDYSGAKGPQHPLPGLRVFRARQSDAPTQVLCDASKAGALWSRALLAEWLHQTLAHAKEPCLVGIDHAFSFPEIYFNQFKLTADWDTFLDDFCQHWPSDENGKTVRELLVSNRTLSDGRIGQSRWRRLTERYSKGAKSVFHFSVPGSVASSTHAGIPWLRWLRRHPDLRNRLHFWPFDGWIPEPHKHVIAEVYPSIWNKLFESNLKTQDEHDAWTVCRALQCEFSSLAESKWFAPQYWQNHRLSESQLSLARFEGWILGLE
jgi:hypothetical protein